MMKNQSHENNGDFLNLKQAAEYAHVSPQAIYVAIKKNRLKAIKQKKSTLIKIEDIDEYRLTKYNKQLLRRNGEYVYDLNKGNLSPQHVSKIISEMLKRPYHVRRVYYLLYCGQLTGYRNGSSWIIKKEDAIALYEKEKLRKNNKNIIELKFA